ncbi:MAG: S9 family peptidase [Anaerolineae bacterium]|nr:S9 family peptidase [Anaerolineae bacterium]
MTESRKPITAEDLYRMTYVEDPRISPDGRWIAYVQVTVDKMDNGYKRNLWLVPTLDGTPIQITRTGKDSTPRWSPDSRWLAFVSGRDDKPQIYLLRIGEPGGEARALTSMPNGASSPEWSPDGSQIAFLAGMNAALREKEDRGEEDTPPTDKLDAKQRKERREQDESKRFDPRVVERIPYRTGTAFLNDHFQQVYVIRTAEGLDKAEAKPRRLTSAETNHGAPQWSRDGEWLYTGRMGDPSGDEPWRWNNLYRIRVADGNHEQFTDEQFASHSPLPSPDGKWLAFIRFPRERISERLTRLAIMPAAGGEIRDLNLDLDRSVTDVRWLPDSSGLVFGANDYGNVELYHLALADNQITKQLSGTFQIESIDVHPTGIAYTLSTPFSPNELFWKPADAESIPKTHVNQKFLDSVMVQETHEIRWQAPDGTEIQGWYMLPVGYETGKQYPLALNIHGGPHIMWGPSFKSQWHDWQFQAARGYVVLYANPRGADGYGEDFMMALHGRWGELAYGDLMAGVDAIIETGIVDPDRLAVGGGSYGGYMTSWIVSHTDRFKAAAAQRGVYNLLAFPGVTDIASFVQTEMGYEVWENPNFLWENSPVAHAHKIRTPLLIIHAENDYRVPISEGEQLFAIVRRNGGTVKMVRYQREGHEMTRSGEPEHRVSNLTHIIEWFDRYCL